MLSAFERRTWPISWDDIYLHIIITVEITGSFFYNFLKSNCREEHVKVWWAPCISYVCKYPVSSRSEGTETVWWPNQTKKPAVLGTLKIWLSENWFFISFLFYMTSSNAVGAVMRLTNSWNILSREENCPFGFPPLYRWALKQAVVQLQEDPWSWQGAEGSEAQKVRLQSVMALLSLVLVWCNQGKFGFNRVLAIHHRP